MPPDWVLYCIGGGVITMAVSAIYQTLRDWPSREDFQEAKRLTKILKASGLDDYHVSAWDVRYATKVYHIITRFKRQGEGW